jgi:hypothetical protein
MVRTDRSEKLKNRKLLKETVVKCSLHKLLLGDDDGKRKIIDSIEKRVFDYSQKIRNATLALGILIRKAFDGQSDVTTVDVPMIFDVTFVRQLILGTDGSCKTNECIKQLYEDYPKLLVNRERSVGDRNTYSFGAIKLKTNISNHLVTNFLRVLKKWLYSLPNLKDEDAVKCLYDINGWTFKREQNDLNVKEIDLVVKTAVHILGNEKKTEMWFKKEENLIKILKFFIFANRYFACQKMTLNSILPLCKIKAHFVTIDTSVMRGILKEIGVLKSAADKTVEDKDAWASFLNTKKIKGSSNEFTGTIDTDGLVVNVHFQRPINLKETTTPLNLKGKRVIAIDPGRTNIVYAIDQEENVFKLTRSQYYTESGATKANKLSNKWNLSIKKELEKLSCASPKSYDLKTFLEFVEIDQTTAEPLWNEYFKKRWREQRFRLYGGKKRVFHNLINRMGCDAKTVIAYGNAKFSSGGKNEQSVPTSRTYKEFSYRVPIISIDEFRTTKICYKTDSLLELVRVKNSKKNVRGLLWCHSTNQNITSHFVDRDKNAALNILRCALSVTRPPILNRSLCQGRLTQKVGKIIKK